MNNLKITEIINNAKDELERAREMLQEYCAEEAEYSMLLSDIDSSLERMEDIIERIDLAMLMAAQVGDVAIPTIEQIYEVEAGIELPYYKGYVDTEVVYDMLGEWCKNIVTDDDY